MEKYATEKQVALAFKLAQETGSGHTKEELSAMTMKEMQKTIFHLKARPKKK